MSGSGPPSPGVRCRQCARPFGAAVAFCPFCGAAQAAPSAPTPAFVSPGQVPAKLASVPNTAATPAGVSVAGAQTTAGTPPPARTPQPAGKPPPARKTKPAPSRPPRQRPWRVSTIIWLLGLIVSGYMLRPHPTGTLIVEVSPGVPGRVLVDGNRAGAAGQKLDVVAGPHRLGYEAEGWIASQQQVTIVANRQRRVTVALLAAPATIVLDLQTPNTALRLDGAPVAVPDTGLRVAAGRHRLTASRPGFAAVTVDLLLARGERRNVAIILSPLVAPPVAHEVTRVALPQNWSEPVIVPPHTSFTIAAGSRFRLRVGREVFLVQPGNQMNFGDMRGQSLQVKAIDGQPVEVHFSFKPEE